MIGGVNVSELGFSTFILNMQSILGAFAKRALCVLLLLIAFSAVVPILPDDPLRSDIITIRSTFQQWSDFISWLIPADYIVTSVHFAILCKISYYVFHLVMDMLGVNFFKSFTGVNISDGQYVDDDGSIL